MSNWLVLSWHILSWRKSYKKWACWGVLYALWGPLLLYSMHRKRCRLLLYNRYGNWPFNLVTFCAAISVLVCDFSDYCFVFSPSAFLMYTASAIAITLFLVLYCAPRYGQTNILVYIGICSIIGSLTVSDST